MSAASRAVTTAQVAAIMIMSVGIGWLNGNFVQPVDTSYGPFIDTVHFLPFVLLLIFGLRYLQPVLARGAAAEPRKGSRNWITGIAIFLLLLTTAFVILGIVFPNPSAVGVHNFEDWMPVITIDVGALLWLEELVRAALSARPAAEASPEVAPEAAPDDVVGTRS